jgi:hypothetical protein
LTNWISDPLNYDPVVYTFWNDKHLTARRGSILSTGVEYFLSDSFNLKHLFMLPYKNIADLTYAFAKDIHIPPSELNGMAMFDVLMLLEAHNDFIDKQEKGQSGEDTADMIEQQRRSMESMYKQQQASMPKMPTMPSMPQMPNFSNMNFGS